MVRTIGRLACVAGLTAALAACDPLQFLTRSIFPADLTRWEARVDLTSTIPADLGTRFEATMLDAPSARYVVLLSADRSWVGVHLIVLDGDLAVLARYTNEELDALDASRPFVGKSSMIDPSGNLAIGNRLFSMASGVPVYVSTIPRPLDGHCVALPESGTSVVGMHIEGAPGTQEIRYDRYDKAWTFIDQRLQPFGSDSSYKIHHVFARPVVDPAAPGDLYVVAQGSTSSLRFLIVPRTAVAAGALMPPVYEYYYGFQIDPSSPLAGLEAKYLALTDAGFVGVRNLATGSEMVLFDSRGAILQSTTTTQDIWTAQHLYGYSGGWYVFDQKARTIVRCPRWW